jgi:ABC-type nickel/cobalt efflux system permease component RcnA
VVNKNSNLKKWGYYFYGARNWLLRGCVARRTVTPPCPFSIARRRTRMTRRRRTRRRRTMVTMTISWSASTTVAVVNVSLYYLLWDFLMVSFSKRRALARVAAVVVGVFLGLSLMRVWKEMSYYWKKMEHKQKIKKEKKKEKKRWKKRRQKKEKKRWKKRWKKRRKKKKKEKK